MIATYRDGPCGCEESVALRKALADATTLHVAENDAWRAEVERLVDVGCRTMPLDVTDLALRVGVLEEGLRAIRKLLAYQDYCDLASRTAALAVADRLLDASTVPAQHGAPNASFEVGRPA